MIFMLRDGYRKSLRSSGELWRPKLSSGGPGESSGADVLVCVRISWKIEQVWELGEFVGPQN